MAKIDVGGELNPITTEGILADSQTVVNRDSSYSRFHNQRQQAINKALGQDVDDLDSRFDSAVSGLQIAHGFVAQLTGNTLEFSSTDQSSDVITYNVDNGVLYVSNGNS